MAEVRVKVGPCTLEAVSLTCCDTFQVTEGEQETQGVELVELNQSPKFPPRTRPGELASQPPTVGSTRGDHSEMVLSRNSITISS